MEKQIKIYLTIIFIIFILFLGSLVLAGWQNPFSYHTWKNVWSCKTFSGGWADDCHLKLTISYAIFEKNPALCKNFLNSLTADYCFSGVGVGLNDIKICEQIKDKSIKKDSEGSAYDQCYSGIAANLNNEKLCSYIKNDSTASMCYIDVSKSKKDILICEQIKGRDNKDNFYYDQCVQLPVNIGSVDCSSGCEKITEEGRKNTCYRDCADKQKDSSICGKITFSSNYLNRTPYDNKQIEINFKNGCYYSVAIAKRDSSLCSKIATSVYGSSTYKEDCVKYIDQVLKQQK